jgi:hypothetical protein
VQEVKGEEGKYKSPNILDFSGRPIRLQKLPQPWMIKAVLSAMGLILLAGVVWKLNSGGKNKVVQPNPATASTCRPANKSLPGMSLHMIIRIHNLPVNRRKYLFDFGHEKAGRLSIYISSDDIFTFGFLDAEEEFHPVQIPLRGNGVPLNEFFYLSCELGLNGQTTEMIVLVDGEQKGALELPFRVDVGSLDVPGGVVGADLSGQNGAKIDIKEFFAYSKTLDEKDLDGARNYLKTRLTAVHQYVEFNGNQWMRVNQVGRRNLTQKNKKHQPIYRIESATP